MTFPKHRSNPTFLTFCLWQKIEIFQLAIGDFGFRERLKHRSMGFLDNRSSVPVPQDERLSSECRFFWGAVEDETQDLCAEIDFS